MAVNIEISARRLALVVQRPDPHLKAYDRWLFAQSRLQAWDSMAFHEATKLLEQIIEETPDFSPAYSTLAQLQNSVHFVHPGVFRTGRRADQALGYARQATKLDAIDSRAQLCLGWAHAMARQHELAEIHHKLAEELNQNDHWTATSVALGFATRGQLQEATKAADRALGLRLDLDRHHWAYHQQIRFMTGDYVGSVEAAKAAGAILPISMGWESAALAHLGRRREATAAMQRYLEGVRSRWCGAEAPTDENVARWTMHCVPLKRVHDWQHLCDGLAQGGLPVSHLAHNRW